MVLIKLDIALTIAAGIFYTFKQLAYYGYIKAYYRFSYDRSLKWRLIILCGAPFRLALLVGDFLYVNTFYTIWYSIVENTLVYCRCFAPTILQISSSIAFSCFMIYYLYYSERKVTITDYSNCLSTTMAEEH